jgi:hypothetical protein
MKKTQSSAQGKIVDFKVLETVKGKLLAHLQVQDENQRVSSVMVPTPIFKRSEQLISSAFDTGEEVEVHGSLEDLGTHVRLIAKEIEFLS